MELNELNGNGEAQVEIVGLSPEQHDQLIERGEDRPRPEWIKGVCPQCGDDVVGNCYYVGGRGYLITRECWSSLGKNPTCTYRKVM